MDGAVYIDCLAGAGTLALGHNHPVVIESIRQHIDAGYPLHTLDLTTPVKDDFVHTLLGTLPREFAKNAADPVLLAIGRRRGRSGHQARQDSDWPKRDSRV